VIDIYDFYVDQLFVTVESNLVIGEGKRAQFIATGSGINKRNFKYQWKRRGSSSFPNKALGVNETILTIPDVIKSDEGYYYCVVTNEWGRSERSDNITLTVQGMCSYIVKCMQYSVW